MNYEIIFYILGWVVKVEGMFMFLPALVSAIYGEWENCIVFSICTVIFTAIGWAITRSSPQNTQFFAKEGYVAVSLSWIVMSIIGAIPFVATGEIPSVVNALFEIVSGFTTTGASIVTDVEALSHGILFWRSFSHWIGGMGILVFLLIVLPSTGGQSIYLVRAESTGTSVGKLVPRMQKTAFYLYAIYFFLSLAMFVFLIAGKMNVFEALCTVFGTAGTGGFGVRGDSIAGYSTYIQMVTAVFMFIFGINFSFYFLIINRKIKDAFSMEEVRWYCIIFIAVTAAVSLSLIKFYDGNAGLAFKDGLFQVSSIMTSTGFATTDFDKWPLFTKTLLLCLMFVGACAGSTGGGMKVSRFIIWFKAVIKEVRTLIHPRSIKILRMDGKKIEHEVIRQTNVFLFTYILIFAASLLIISLDSVTMTEAFSAVDTTINNIGPGLESLGPTGNFDGLSAVSKLVLIFDMLIGRLEVFPLIVLLTPATWRK